MHFFVLRPCLGDLIITARRDSYDRVMKDSKVEVKGIFKIDFKHDISNVYASYRTEFLSKGQHSIEICGTGPEDEVNFLAGYDPEQIY